MRIDGTVWRTAAIGILAVGLTLGFCTGAQAQAQAPAGTSGDAGADGDKTKLLKWTTLENAFLRANRRHQQLPKTIAALRSQLKKSEGKDEKRAIMDRIAALQKESRKLAAAMNVIFGVGTRRDYVYNPVRSTVYVRIGTVEQVFGRAIRTRDSLRSFIAERNKALQETPDTFDDVEEAKRERDRAVQQYRVVAAALQVVYGVAPQRDYTYDPDDATLYLNVSDEEVENLKRQLEERRKEQAGESPADAEQP